jgi:putative transposase
VRLKQRGIIVGKERLRRIMNENDLLLDQPSRIRVSPYEHTGTIITDTRNAMWGTDIKEFKLTFGKIYFMGVIDHYHDKIVGHYVNDRMRAEDVLEALRNGVRNEMGKVEKDICKTSNLFLRLDNGRQYESKKYTKEINYLGITKSHTMVRSPESNGIIERFHGILVEQLGDLAKCKCLDDAKKIIDKFVEDFNNYWLIHRLKLTSPIEFEKINKSDNGENEPGRFRPFKEDFSSSDEAILKKNDQEKSPSQSIDNIGPKGRSKSSVPDTKMKNCLEIKKGMIFESIKLCSFN